MAAYTNTKDGKIEAPSWYKNADGSTPATMQKGLTKEKWEAQNASANRKREQEANRQAAKKKADAHLAQGGTRNDQAYTNILKEGGVTSAQVQKMQRSDKKARYEQKQQDRKNEARAYQQFNRDRADFRKKSGNTGQRKVDQRAHYEHLQKTKGGYGGSQAHQNAVSQLMGTGQKFSNLDVQREMGSASTYNMKGLYKAYGGYENYMENHSVGSGNWKSRIPQDQLGTMKQADDSQRQYFSDQNKMYEGMSNKYGNYEWFKKSQKRANEQGNRFNQSFDRRAQRMKNSGYGNVYGY